MSVAACLAKGESITPNLIRNGSFVGHIGGWYPGTVSINPSFAGDVSRSAGSGCLALEVSDEFTRRIFYRQLGLPALDLDGATSLDIVAYGKSANPSALITIGLDFRTDAYMVATTLGTGAGPDNVNVAGASWTEISERDIAVPEGATHVGITFSVTVASGTDPIYIDDVYVGPSGLDSPPYPSASKIPLAFNRFTPFGDFEASLSPQWETGEGVEDMEIDTVAPISGVGSLKVISPGTFTEEGAVWFGGGAAANSAAMMIVTPGEPLRVQFKQKGSGHLQCKLGYVGISQPEIVWDGMLTASPTTETVDVIVPAGAIGIREFYFWTPNDEDSQAVTLWIDDISIGTPQ